VATGTLYLIPTPLGDTPLDLVLPEESRRVAARLRHFVVERPKTARAFLKQVGTELPIQELDLRELSEHTKADELDRLLQPLLDGVDVGLLSEAGCPAVADPGADLVRLAHRRGIAVKPLVGPSSILLSLMGSGLVGQRFAFHGYLPATPEERTSALKDLEKRAERDDATQIFIETPYRSRAMLDAILSACRADTWLGLGCSLTAPTEIMRTRRVEDWRSTPPEIDRLPCAFLIHR
jgi:16S rRNA (cytidine1402-2'-O)-methyltransferase